MNPKTYAEELYNTWTISKEGPGQALKIAKRCFDASDPKNWVELPIGPVFASKGYGSDRWDLKTKELKKTHEFWKHVYYNLKKKFK